MKHFLKYLMFPPICVGCGERFDLFHEEELPVFCLKCRVKWETELAVLCETCARPLQYCTCMPELLRKAGCSALHKLFYYEPGTHRSVGSHTVLTIKDRQIPRVFSFLGSLWKRGLPPLPQTDVLITWIPRSREGASRAGFDQGQELSRALSKPTGYPLVRLFCRRGGMAQKELTAVERINNVRASVHLDRRYRRTLGSVIEGKTVLLVDDVVTTGATMMVCTQLLLEHGAERVIGICLAVDQKGNGTHTEETD